MDLSKFTSLAAKIDTLNYYQILGLKQDAPVREIKRAYHKRARSIHPDNFFNHPDKTFKEAIDKIFKRINEAYLVLRDEKKRNLYDRGLVGPNKRLRYTDEDEQAIRREAKEAEGATPQGRKYFAEAKRLQNKGDYKRPSRRCRWPCNLSLITNISRKFLKNGKPCGSRVDFWGFSCLLGKVSHTMRPSHVDRETNLRRVEMHLFLWNLI